MKKAVITFFETPDWQASYIRKKLKNTSVKFFPDTLDASGLKLAKNTEILGIFIGSKIDNKTLSALPKLQLIVTMSTGYDHIDLKACHKRGVSVTNVPFYGENTVAEHTLALILSISRRIHQSYQRTSRGIFSFEDLRGFDLKGKILGVIGTGHIGRHVIRMAQGFEMNIIAYDAYPDKVWAKKNAAEYLPLNSLLRRADIITLHAPYNPKTHHLLNEKNMRLIKKGGIIINTSRGALIDTAAMVKALQDGRLGALGLDVLEGEQQIKEEAELLSGIHSMQDLKINMENHILMHSDKVILTPHNAFNSDEAIQRILDTTILNIKQFTAKQKLENQVK